MWLFLPTVCTSITSCYPIFTSSLTACLILWQVLIRQRTTDRINLQIKCLWLVLIYRSEQKWAVCVHECVCHWGCVLMACIKKSNNLTDGEGLVRSRLCDGEQLLRLDCSRSTRQTWQGGGVPVYVCVRGVCMCEVGGGGCLSLTRPLLPITRLTMMWFVARME